MTEFISEDTTYNYLAGLIKTATALTPYGSPAKTCCYCGCRVNNTKECSDCWEVRRRLEHFLAHEQNRTFTLQLLERYNGERILPAESTPSN